MRASKAKTARIPKYPTRLALLEDPSLLERHVPASWKTNAHIAGLLSFMLFAAGCASGDGSDGKRKGAALVAPVFKHGEGRGAVGCVMVVPPRFLSEAEMLGIVEEEFSKAGIDASRKDVSLGAKVSDLRLGDDGSLSFSRWGSHELRADVYDPKLKIAVSCVNFGNYLDKTGLESVENGSSVQSFDFRGSAEKIAEEFGRNGKDVFFGSFYDPHPFDKEALKALPRAPENPKPAPGEPFSEWKKRKLEYQKAFENYAEKREEVVKRLGESDEAKAKELFREQVKDFVEWLKAQGAL